MTHTTKQPSAEPHEHDWVFRVRGYVEDCGPAICTICGQYGCWCDAGYSHMSPERKSDFFRRGIRGNNHEIEKRLAAQRRGKKKYSLPLFQEKP